MRKAKLHRPAQGQAVGARPVRSTDSKARLQAFFTSKPVQALKEQMCDIGRRMWHRAYVDGNGGNIVIRIGDDLALCTPTLVSKGFMKPEDICLVNLEGKQLAGARQRTSEILMHLQMLKRQPRMVASVHGHPPYGTAFGLAGVEPPNDLLTEFEFFVSAAIAPYRMPGTPELGQVVADLTEHYNTILMSNHGVVAWSHKDVEDAYFKLEILEAYCQTVLLARQLGKPLKVLQAQQVQDLLKIKRRFGIPDPRSAA